MRLICDRRRRLNVTLALSFSLFPPFGLPTEPTAAAGEEDTHHSSGLRVEEEGLSSESVPMDKEKELVEFYEAAKKAADAASSPDAGKHEESRCIDALEQLKKFPVNYKILVNTQVGKRVKHLTKHPRQKIREFAHNLVEIWKDVILKETNKNKNGGSDNKVESPNGERAQSGKFQRSSSVKVEKTDRNGMSRPSSDKVQNVDVKSEKSYRSENVKVEKIAKDVKQQVSSGAKKMSSSTIAPPKLKTMVKSNDSVRDKIRELLHEALSRVAGEADEDMMDEVNACDPIRVAVTVESVLFEKWGPSNGAQKVKYRSLMFNLKDQNNPDFRRKVLLGVVEPERLINMSTAEMASEQRKQENEKIKEKALFECERGAQPKATTDQFKCGRCGQRKCTYYQMQTRSADEPMTTYVTCVVCNNRWKFC